MDKYISKIGLALSGGGALGLAHIGVLEQLEKNNISIDVISGSSAGAIIAGIYASAGMDGLHKFAEEVSKVEILKQKRPLKILTPTSFYELIFELVGKYTAIKIEQTDIPLTIVATNIRTGNLTLFEHGDLLSAIKASCAYPGVFPIQKIEGEKYIDGGITCNLPSTAIRDKVDFLIASDLNSIPVLSEESIVKLNRLRIMARSIEIIQRQLADLYARECDYNFKMDFKNLKWYSFNKIDFIIQKGKKEAARQMPALIDLMKQRSR